VVSAGSGVGGISGSERKVDSDSSEKGVECPGDSGRVSVSVAVVEVMGAGLTTVDWLPFRSDMRVKRSSGCSC